MVLEAVLVLLVVMEEPSFMLCLPMEVTVDLLVATEVAVATGAMTGTGAMWTVVVTTSGAVHQAAAGAAAGVAATARAVTVQRAAVSVAAGAAAEAAAAAGAAAVAGPAAAARAALAARRPSLPRVDVGRSLWCPKMGGVQACVLQVSDLVSKFLFSCCELSFAWVSPSSVSAAVLAAFGWGVLPQQQLPTARLPSTL